MLIPSLIRVLFVLALVLPTAGTARTRTIKIPQSDRSRAAIGKHLHVDDIASLMKVWEAKAVILCHLSRRTNLMQAREYLSQRIGEEEALRVHILMDHRANRERYERQLAEAGVRAPG